MVGLQAYAMQPGLHGTGVNPRSVRVRQKLYALSSTSSPTSLFIPWLWKRRGLFYTGCWTKHSWGSHMTLRHRRVCSIRTRVQDECLGLWSGEENIQSSRGDFEVTGLSRTGPWTAVYLGTLAAVVWMSPPRLVGWKVITVAAMLGGGTRWERSWGWVWLLSH